MIVSEQQEESPLQGGPLLNVPDSSEIEALAVDVARDSGLPLSRAKEILVTQYFRHNTEMLKERHQWLRHREQQEQRAMLFMDDQRQRWERLKKMNEEEIEDEIKIVSNEKMERETRKQNDLHFRTMYEMKRERLRGNVRTIVYLVWTSFRTAIFLDAMICAVTLFLSSLRALELLKVLDDMYSDCEPNTNSRWFWVDSCLFPQQFCMYFVHAKLFITGMLACLSYGLVQNYCGAFVAQMGVLTVAYVTIYEQVVQELEKMQMLLPSIGYSVIFASVLLLYSDSSYFDKGRNRWLLVVYFIFPISAVCVAMLSAVGTASYPEIPWDDIKYFMRCFFFFRRRRRISSMWCGSIHFENILLLRENNFILFPMNLPARNNIFNQLNHTLEKSEKHAYIKILGLLGISKKTRSFSCWRMEKIHNCDLSIEIAMRHNLYKIVAHLLSGSRSFA